MQRQIKFRAWDKEDKEMIDADSFFLGEKFQVLEDAFSEAQEHFEIMQFTGLKDKNGKEIYEGDIISYGFYVGYAFECLHIVEWDSKHANFNTKNIYNSDYASSVDTHEAEVVGNIFQNPELIQEQAHD